MTTILTESITNQESVSGTRYYRWRADKFRLAVDAGVFKSPERMELIRGVVMEQPEQTPQHFLLTNRLTQGLRKRLPSRFNVYGRRPARLAEDSEPRADVLAAVGDATQYQNRHPTAEEVVLVVEVADTSVAYDTGEKALLYAEANIGDYWVVLPEAGEIVVHRDPTENGYRNVTRVGEEGTVTPLAASAAIVSVRDLLGLPVREEGIA